MPEQFLFTKEKGSLFNVKVWMKLLVKKSTPCYGNEIEIGSCRGEVMKRSELESFIMETYNAEADYPWLKYPNYEVFRHCNNRKWLALIMDVPKNKLGLQGEEVLEVVNFKCDPILIGTLREEPGFFPAYHMSKDSWITVALDGSVSDDKIKMLLDTSYEATASKTHKKC